MPEPAESEGSVLVRARATGICGTDLEIVKGEYGWPPPDATRLILGHESLGIVEKAPSGCGFEAGDLVAGIVRRPDPVPCPACAVNQWDMCRNGQYTERGIKQRHGYCSEHFRVEPDFLVHVDKELDLLGVLTEPTSVVAKAWDQIERIGQRSEWEPRTVLITGAGPVGLLAALLGVQRGLEIHVLDRTETGLKPQLVRELGATYHAGKMSDIGSEFDIIVECTGVPAVIVDAIRYTAPEGILCLAGMSSGGHSISFDMGEMNRTMVLENNVIFGSVNANKHHYDLAAQALARSDKSWLGKLITRREPLENWESALKRNPDDIKVIIEFPREGTAR